VVAVSLKKIWPTLWGWNRTIDRVRVRSISSDCVSLVREQRTQTNKHKTQSVS